MRREISAWNWWSRSSGITASASPRRRTGRRPVLGVARVPVVLVRVVGVPAGVGAEVELEALPVAGGDAALQVGAAEGDGFLADAALLPHACNPIRPEVP